MKARENEGKEDRERGWIGIYRGWERKRELGKGR